MSPKTILPKHTKSKTNKKWLDSIVHIRSKQYEINSISSTRAYPSTECRLSIAVNHVIYRCATLQPAFTGRFLSSILRKLRTSFSQWVSIDPYDKRRVQLDNNWWMVDGWYFIGISRDSRHKRRYAIFFSTFDAGMSHWAVHWRILILLFSLQCHWCQACSVQKEEKVCYHSLVKSTAYCCELHRHSNRPSSTCMELNHSAHIHLNLPT
jgi:hypothetical protein